MKTEPLGCANNSSCVARGMPSNGVIFLFGLCLLLNEDKNRLQNIV